MKAITTRFIPCSNTRGSRVAAFDGDGNRVVLSKDDSLKRDDTHRRAAVALCRKMGWSGTLVQGWLRRGEEVFVFLSEQETFKVDLE